jgi:hypothetical protein
MTLAPDLFLSSGDFGSFDLDHLEFVLTTPAVEHLLLLLPFFPGLKFNSYLCTGVL